MSQALASRLLAEATFRHRSLFGKRGHIKVQSPKHEYWIVYRPLPLVQPTPQQLFDLSAGLGRGELVNYVQRRLAVGVSHRGINTTLSKRKEESSQFRSSFLSH